MMQELWLTEQQLPLLQQTGAQFCARSGMQDSISTKMYQGRPHGGVCIAWSQNLNHLIFPLANYRHKRVVGAELRTENDNFLLLCAYMPFFNASNRAECMADTIDAISMLESIIEEFPCHKIILGGDLNTELKGNSPFDPLWNEFTSRYKLSYCDSFFPPDSITYRHESLDQSKWNDHLIVSSCLLENNLVVDQSILDDGENTSDHFPIMIKISVELNEPGKTENAKAAAPTLRWSKISDDLKSEYSSRLDHLVRSAPATTILCDTKCVCDKIHCHMALQSEYNMLIACMRQADSFLPRVKPGIEKDWWTIELSSLKSESKDIHAAWINAGRPTSGPIHQERLRVRALYKRAIRAAQRAPKQAAFNRMHTAMADKDTNAFWKSWRSVYNRNKSDLAPVVNGCSNRKDIAETFKSNFSKNSVPNNVANVKKLNDRFHSEFESFTANHSANCDCKKSYMTTLDVIDGLSAMKGGKSFDESGISVEHLHYAPLSLLIRLTYLFNMMLKHAFVPEQFRSGFMIPIIKDHQGDHSDPNNYRGITISPIISKLFEHILKNIFLDYLTTSNYQFGFKKKSSTTTALHCLKETVNYFIGNGSRVFCGFLDASKAFDRLVHSGLFIKLIERKTPMVLLRIIMSWYKDLKCRVKWGDEFSEWFTISAGVRQGGVLSPDLYSIYVDDLIRRLTLLGKGCYVYGIFAAALFYADDMAIIAPSIKGLQSLLDECAVYCCEWDICLNVKKTKCLYFGKQCESLHNLSVDGKSIEWVSQWTYLGVSLKSGTAFNCSVSERVKKFYRCANAIFRIDGYSDELVMLQLAESHCIPLLTYAIEIVHVSNRDERRQLRVAYNSVYRKIFGYRRSQSVSELQRFLGKPTWEELLETRKNKFHQRLSDNTDNSLACAFPRDPFM